MYFERAREFLDLDIIPSKSKVTSVVADDITSDLSEISAVRFTRVLKTPAKQHLMLLGERVKAIDESIGSEQSPKKLVGDIAERSHLLEVRDGLSMILSY